MSNDRVFISSGAFPETDLSEVLKTAEAWGATRLELSSGLAHRPDLPEIARAARGRFDLLLHNYFPAPAQPFVLNLAALDPETLERSLAHCRRALDLSAELGGGFFSVHSGFAAHAQAGHLGRSWNDLAMVPLDVARETFINSVRELTAYAASIGLDFLIENNVLAPFNLRTDGLSPLLGVAPHELLEFVRLVDAPNFGILLDAAHLKVSARTLGFDLSEAMEALLPVTRAFHLSDNDGTADTNQPFHSDAWFLPWLLRAPDAPLIIEAYRLDEKTLSQCRRILADPAVA